MQRDQKEHYGKFGMCLGQRRKPVATTAVAKCSVIFHEEIFISRKISFYICLAIEAQ